MGRRGGRGGGPGSGCGRNGGPGSGCGRNGGPGSVCGRGGVPGSGGMPAARRPPGSHTMHGVPRRGFVTYGIGMSTSPPSDERRGPGRPRKWATEADRARAYRQRKALEHASIDELRVERRTLRRQLSDALRSRRRAEAAVARAEDRADRLGEQLAHVRQALDQARAEVTRLSVTLEAERIAHRPPPMPPEPSPPGLTRQQRRAMERANKKRT